MRATTIADRRERDQRERDRRERNDNRVAWTPSVAFAGMPSFR